MIMLFVKYLFNGKSDNSTLLIVSKEKNCSKITNQHAQIISFWRLALNVMRSQKGTWNKHDKQDISHRFVDFQNGKA